MADFEWSLNLFFEFKNTEVNVISAASVKNCNLNEMKKVTYNFNCKDWMPVFKESKENSKPKINVQFMTSEPKNQQTSIQNQK